MGAVVVATAAAGAVLVPTDFGEAATTDTVSAGSAVPIPVLPNDDDIIAQAQDRLDRSAPRVLLPDAQRAESSVTSTKVALRDDVAIRADRNDSAPVLAKVAKGDRLSVTGKRSNGFVQVIHRDLPRWVAEKDIADRLPAPKPKPTPKAVAEKATSGAGGAADPSVPAPSAAVSGTPCARGSAVEAGLMPDTVKVYRAVCAAFPQIASYGGTRGGGGEHATGQALDIMVSGAFGQQVAAWLQQNASRLGIEYLIYAQRIWRPATSSGWRPMSDRGSVTANHYDHVHVTTYGTSATG